MRLIDADELDVSLYRIRKGYSQYDTMMFYEISNLIDDAPTIEAIPVSYIDEEIERCKKEGMEAEAYFLNELLRYWENK